MVKCTCSDWLVYRTNELVRSYLISYCDCSCLFQTAGLEVLTDATLHSFDLYDGK